MGFNVVSGTAARSVAYSVELVLLNKHQSAAVPDTTLKPTYG